MKKMNRTRAVSRCDVCKEAPKENANGLLTCACGTSWSRFRGERGTEEDHRLLTSKGFQLAEVNGDAYYVLPEGGHILYLYPDGKWDCGEAPKSCQTLEEYLAYLEPFLMIIRR
jgi:hypothetical protein